MKCPKYSHVCESFTENIRFICGGTKKEQSTTFINEKTESRGTPVEAVHEGLQEGLQDGERLFAFLDDVYAGTTPELVGHVYAALHIELGRHSSMQIDGGKRQVWNAAGERPPACGMLERLALESRVWRGSDLPLCEQGIRILGTPSGHPEYVRVQLEVRMAKHRTFSERIPAVQDVQSAWALLLHPITCSEWCALNWSGLSQYGMTQVCCDAPRQNSHYFFCL